MSVVIQRLKSVTQAQVEALARVLIDCVQGGASVSFMNPLSTARAEQFWSGVAAAVARDERALIVAAVDGEIVGTVQLVLDLPENQPHRADLAKMLVRPRERRQGVGALLLLEAERVARELNRTLLVLDTASADAKRLYAKLGWIEVGTVPDYALLPDGGFCDTVFFYRRL
jgi:GNAT superfamily N-acetyltransferase